MTKRPLNICGQCGYTWYPRGRYVSHACPRCKSTAVSAPTTSPLWLVAGGFAILTLFIISSNIILGMFVAVVGIVVAVLSLSRDSGASDSSSSLYQSSDAYSAAEPGYAPPPSGLARWWPWIAGGALVVFMCMGLRAPITPIVSRPSAMATATAIPRATSTSVARVSVSVRPEGLEIVTVTEVRDDGTILVSTSEGPLSVRLLGLTLPRAPIGDDAGQCYGSEALAALRTLIHPGDQVDLEVDPNVRGADQRYVWLTETEMLNNLLIRRGAAYATSDDLRYGVELRRAAIRARDAEAGAWSPSACGGRLIEVTPTP